MADTKILGRQRGLYLCGLSIVGLGGWLLVRLAVQFAVGLAGKNAPALNAAMLWRGVGGGALIAIGFTAMAYSAAAAENWSVDFGGDQAYEVAVNESEFSTAESQEEIFGPPRPLIVYRCQNCRALNEQSQQNCSHCGGAM